jgi:hypothetical protein
MHVIALIQCGGLWFINGKVSITWNLKQAIVQKPKESMEGHCFLRPKVQEKERMKAMSPPEDVDPEGVVTAVVDDSDDEEDYPAPPPPPVARSEEEQQTVPAVETQQPVASQPDDGKKKRVVAKKKTTDA